MNDRIHAHLDGELPYDELSARDKRALHAYRDSIDAALGPVKNEPAPDVSDPVMERIAAMESEAATARRRSPARESSLLDLLDWLWRPRRIDLSLRPAFGLAVAAAATVAVLLLPIGQERNGAGPAAVPVQSGGTAMAAGGSGPVHVHFRLDAPDAESVRLTGDFTAWQASVELRQEVPGVWTVVVPLEPGMHDYAFVVDGERWVPDPQAEQVDDGFGGTNSRVAVVRRGASL